MRTIYGVMLACGWGIWLGVAYGAEDCAAQSAAVPATKQASVLQACLEKSSATTQEQMRLSKQSTCEQNARNKGVQHEAFTKFVAECMKRNDVAAAKTRLEDQKKNQPSPLKEIFAALGRPGSSETAQAPLDAAAQQCLERAQKQKMVGNEAKQFRARCEKEIALKQAKEARLLALRQEREQRELDMKIEKEQKALAMLRVQEEKAAAAARLKEEKAAAAEKQKEDKVRLQTPAPESSGQMENNAEGEKQADLLRYKIAGDELNSGKVENAVWYKAFSESNGDDKATQAAYIRLRVEQLRANGQSRPSEW